MASIMLVICFFVKGGENKINPQKTLDFKTQKLWGRGLSQFVDCRYRGKFDRVVSTEHGEFIDKVVSHMITYYPRRVPSIWGVKN